MAEKAPKITKIEPAIASLPIRKRVAAYARVAMVTDRLMHSLSAQVSYYSDLIQRNPEWQYAGVYADSAVSGTGISNRQEFKRLIADCDKGLIDIVLVKSISRFARNTVDLLETVRHLKEIGIEVRFEKEHISSFSDGGELMLTLLASFAQEESRSISENCKWGIRKRYESGQPKNCICYGYRVVDGKLEIVPDEAEIIRQIFDWYLAGDSCYIICKKLNASGAKSYYGKKFTGTVLSYILRQEKYTGNMLLQKFYTESHVSHKERRNNGELPMFLIHDSHPAIISQETFDAVQQEIARRYGVPIVNGIAAKDTYMHHPKDGKKPKSSYPRRKAYWSDEQRANHAEIYKSRETYRHFRHDLSLFIKCETCGQNLTAKTKRYADGTVELWWDCFKHNKVAPNEVKPKLIQDAALKKQIAAILEIPEFDAEIMEQRLSHISILVDRLTFHFRDGHTVTQQYIPSKRQYRRKAEK